MSNHTIKKKSSHFNSKIEIRLEAIKGIQNINVLDAYHADGKIWEEIKKRGIAFELTGIEKNDSNSNFNVIKGNNIEIVKQLNIQEYNVIDLDAYTNPLDLISYLYPLAKKGTIFIYTFCINRMSGAPKQLSVFDRPKCRTITNKYINQMFQSYLYNLGVSKYYERQYSENCFLKKYGYFQKRIDKLKTI